MTNQQSELHRSIGLRAQRVARQTPAEFAQAVNDLAEQQEVPAQHALGDILDSYIEAARHERRKREGHC